MVQASRSAQAVLVLGRRPDAYESTRGTARAQEAEGCIEVRTRERNRLNVKGVVGNGSAGQKASPVQVARPTKCVRVCVRVVCVCVKCMGGMCRGGRRQCIVVAVCVKVAVVVQGGACGGEEGKGSAFQRSMQNAPCK